MKKYKNLFLFVISVFVLFPGNVLAAEFNKLNLSIELPTVGATPATKIIETLSTDEVSKSIELDVKWYELDSDTGSLVEMKTPTFLDKKTYIVQPADPSKEEAWLEELENQGFTLADDMRYFTNNVEWYTYALGGNIFALGGIEKIEFIVEEPIIGEKPATTAKFITTPTDVALTQEVEIEWLEVKDDGSYELMTSETFELGKKYIFSTKKELLLLINEDYIDDGVALLDYRTKQYTNGKITNFMNLEFGPLKELVGVTNKLTNLSNESISQITEKNADYVTTIKANKGYKLPENVYVLIGGSELSVESYTYDAKTGKLIVPAKFVTNNITIAGNGVKVYNFNEFEKNPDTFDGIGNSLVMGFISLIGLFVITIHLNKSRAIN